MNVLFFSVLGIPLQDNQLRQAQNIVLEYAKALTAQQQKQQPSQLLEPNPNAEAIVFQVRMEYCKGRLF